MNLSIKTKRIKSFSEIAGSAGKKSNVSKYFNEKKKLKINRKNII